jgi:hypothetical protein
MFGIFRSKGVTRLRSIYTDYELINQIFQKLKNLNDSEIRTRKAVRDNKDHTIIKELENQIKILGNMDYVMKVKSLRIGELNKAREESIKLEIRQIKKDIDNYTKEYKRHSSNIKNEDPRHVQYLKKHHEEKTRQFNERLKHLKNLLDEARKIKEEIKKDSKKSIEDSQRIIYNV